MASKNNRQVIGIYQWNNPLKMTREWWISQTDDRKKYYVKLMGIVVVVAYLLLIRSLMPVRPDHFFFSILLFVLFMGDFREFLKHWGAFALLWVCYDMLRGVADNIAGRINVAAVYNADKFLFGWLFDGQIPVFMLQHFKLEHAGKWYVSLLNFGCGIFYGNHFTSAILLGWLLYWKEKNRTLFKQFAFVFIVTSYAGLLTFILYPAAPPWYVFKGFEKNGIYNFSQPSIENWNVSAAGLIDFDKLMGFNFFQTLYNTFNPNPYAAVPSLHAAYSIIIAIFAVKRWGRKAAFMWIWPAGMWFSSQWLNHHYIIDLLLGFIYLMFFYFLSTLIYKPRNNPARQ